MQKLNLTVGDSTSGTVDTPRVAGSEHAQWQPAETAPKDGTRILVVENMGRSYGTCIYCIVRFLRDEWVADWNHEVFGKFHYWMPLPKAPS